jgi:hypothetical protein
MGVIHAKMRLGVNNAIRDIFLLKDSAEIVDGNVTNVPMIHIAQNVRLVRSTLITNAHNVMIFFVKNVILI